MTIEEFKMPPNSFSINHLQNNSVTLWGLKCISYDPLTPTKRERKTQAPFRHGTFSQGAGYYDDRVVPIECHLTKTHTKEELRRIIAVLSRRIRIYFWDEPDKFYVGELFEEVDVDVFPKRVNAEFTLPFVCEPFATGPAQRVPLVRGYNPISYNGTQETATLFILRARGGNVQNPVVTITEQITDAF